MRDEPETTSSSEDGWTLGLAFALGVTLTLLMAADAYAEMLRLIPAFAAAWYIGRTAGRPRPVVRKCREPSVRRPVLRQ